VNTPQIFCGTCESMTPVSYGSAGKQLIKLVLSEEARKRPNDKNAPDRNLVAFSLFGKAANHARSHFQEGHDAVVWYYLGSETNGKYINTKTDVVRVLITPPESDEKPTRPAIGRDKPEVGIVREANQAAAEANAQRTEDDDVPF